MSREEVASIIYSLQANQKNEQHLLSFMKNIANGMLNFTSENDPDLSEGTDTDIRQKVMSETVPLALHCTKIEEVLKAIVLMYNQLGLLSTIVDALCKQMDFETDVVIKMVEKSQAEDIELSEMLNNYEKYKKDINKNKVNETIDKDTKSNSIDTSGKVVDATELINERK